MMQRAYKVKEVHCCLQDTILYSHSTVNAILLGRESIQKSRYHVMRLESAPVPRENL